MQNRNPQIPEQFRISPEERDVYWHKIIQFESSMAMFRQMYKRGIIDKAEYAICEKKMAEKYGLPENSVFLGTDPDRPDSFDSSVTDVSIPLVDETTRE